jgi:antitoxin component of MazEF toxin-antitoxin module
MSDTAPLSRDPRHARHERGHDEDAKAASRTPVDAAAVERAQESAGDLAITQVALRGRGLAVYTAYTRVGRRAMKVKLRKVGNSYTVSIPREFVSELGLTEGTDMNIFVREDTVVIKPETESWEQMLEESLRIGRERNVTEEMILDECYEVRYGRPRSK